MFVYVEGYVRAEDVVIISSAEYATLKAQYDIAARLALQVQQMSRNRGSCSCVVCNRERERERERGGA